MNAPKDFALLMLIVPIPQVLSIAPLVILDIAEVDIQAKEVVKILMNALPQIESVIQLSLVKTLMALSTALIAQLDIQVPH